MTSWLTHANDGNLPGDYAQERGAPTRAKFIDFQHDTQKASHDIQTTLARSTENPDENRENNSIYNDDRTCIQLVCNHIHMPPNT